MGLAHDGAALGDGLGGHGQAQVDIGCRQPGVQGGVETAELHGAPVKHGVQVEGVVAGLVVVVVLHIALVPDLLQRGQVLRLVGGQGPGLPQHGFPHLFAPSFGPFLVHLEGLEQDVLLGEHDADEVFQALPVVAGPVHMDVEAAGIVHLGPGPLHPPHTLLEHGELVIGELGRDHLHPVVPALVIIGDDLIAADGFLLREDATVAHQLPAFPLGVFYHPGVISAARILSLCPEIFRQRPCSLPPGDASHFHLHTEALVFQTNHAAAPPLSSSSTARMRRPMASITLTVTLLPACLYAWASEVIASRRSI